mmetsp:Transcript_32143/g.96675  ORF Transcript_32143/g.96675 Transcript_32143/m.96675 type:complete len:539 (-) Transcript_32143:33-1649(-)
MALSKVQEVAVALVSLAMVWVLKGSWPGCGLLVLAAVLRSGLTTGDSQVDAWLARRRRWDLERTARRAVGGPRGTGIERFRAACDAAAARGEPSPDYAAFMASLSADEPRLSILFAVFCALVGVQIASNLQTDGTWAPEGASWAVIGHCLNALSFWMVCDRIGLFVQVFIALRSQRVDPVDRDPDIELFAAVRVGDADAVRRLLAVGFDANVRRGKEDEDQSCHTCAWDTPLYFACWRSLYRPGDVEVARVLIDEGKAVVDAEILTDCGKYTALEASCRKLKVELVRLLLSRGADATRIGKARYYPLEIACGGQSLDEQGCARDDAATSEAKCLEIVKLLLEHGAGSTINRRDANGESQPFFLACRRNRINVACLLLDRGAEIDARPSALYYACRSNNARLAAFLLARGADYDASCHYAISSRRMEAILDGTRAIHSQAMERRPRSWKPPHVVDLFDPLPPPARTRLRAHWLRRIVFHVVGARRKNPRSARHELVNDRHLASVIAAFLLPPASGGSRRDRAAADGRGATRMQNFAQRV